MTELLDALHIALVDEVAGLELLPEGLRAQLDLRYGLVTFKIEHEAETQVVRVSTRLPPPIGAGREFLIWCLALNAQSFRTKLGLDESGFLLVHADLSAPSEDDIEPLREELTERIDELAELIDDSLCTYLLERRLGTPAQLERWAGAPE
jgi:hypothetical protein